MRMSPAIDYDVIWSGTIETSAIRAAQLPPPPDVPMASKPQTILRERVQSFLKKHPFATRQAIADNLRVHRNSIGDALAYLRRLGLIERIDGQTPNRQSMWRLTY